MSFSTAKMITVLSLLNLTKIFPTSWKYGGLAEIIGQDISWVIWLVYSQIVRQIYVKKKREKIR